MREVTDSIAAWFEKENFQIALATVINTWGSAPRQVGAKMAINQDDEIAGSVSGGCVEGAVIEAAREALKTGRAQLLHFGVADETAWQVGLACGGSIDVFVEALEPLDFRLIRAIVAQNERGAVVTVIEGAADIFGRKLIIDQSGSGSGTLDPELREQANSIASQATQPGTVRLDEGTTLFVDVLQPAPTLIAVGGGDIAIALTRMAQLAGFRTVVVDPRRVFASGDRFPHIDHLIQKWPRSAFAEMALTPDTAIALLTHDPKIDDPALKIALHSDVFYIGALGSQKTHEHRLQRLADMGFSQQETARIFAPIGLEIGAATPQEIAVAILAEIVGVRRGRAGAAMN